MQPFFEFLVLSAPPAPSPRLSQLCSTLRESGGVNVEIAKKVFEVSRRMGMNFCEYRQTVERSARLSRLYAIAGAAGKIFLF